MIYVKAFIVGGFICVLGQILLDKTKLTPARILVLFVLVGVVLGSVGVFDYLESFASSGVTVPIVGFGATLVKGTKAIIDEEGALGILTGPLKSGAGGIMAAIISALLVSLFARAKSK